MMNQKLLCKNINLLKISEFLREEGFDVEENLAGMATAFKATKKMEMVLK